MLALPTVAACLSALVVPAQDPSALPVVVVDRDNVEIRESCRVDIASAFVADTDGNGVVQIVGDGITVDFGGKTLAGAPAGQPLDAMAGIGVMVKARGATVRNLTLSGFKVGILAKSATGVTIEDVEVRSNFGQRLRSTTRAEDAADWLWPHENDHDEWRTRYGAAVCVEDSADATVRRVKVRGSQNGIMLVRVEASRIYDNDCSFLSGWGLSMWRSSRNTISRNALDFCVRGYSHGVYNRGQDSAGILLFEQCSNNVFVENSATHGGDGVFAFAGKQALGQNPPPAGAPADWHARRGCNENVFMGNDLSFAAAHGLELTFSFGNTLYGNRMVGNGICGMWGGYSQETRIVGNHFTDNGEMAYGLERGGINIEHGTGNQILGNILSRNPCAVHLWSDADEELMRTPWAAANGGQSRDNAIVANRFDNDAIGIQLRDAGPTTITQNTFTDVGTDIEADAASRAAISPSGNIDRAAMAPPAVEAIGDTRPVGARRSLEGRENILMTEWGPYDHERPELHENVSSLLLDEWRLLGPVGQKSTAVIGRGPLRVRFDSAAKTFRVYTTGPNLVCPYELRVTLEDGRRISGFGTVAWLDWRIRLFPWTADPRENPDAWHAQAEGPDTLVFDARTLDLDFGNGSPADALRRLAETEDLHPTGPAVSPRTLLDRAAVLPADHFGTIATTEATFKPGTYRISTTSDDGVRVWIGDKLVIDNWTWHGPTVDTGLVSFPEETTVPIRVEHFELDGVATLRFGIAKAG